MLLRLVLAAVLLSASVHAAPFRLPIRFATDPVALVPDGWGVEVSIEGELNGDEETDRVLVLLQKQAKEGEDRKRALVVLFRKGEGFEVAGTNGSLLACFECLGMKGGDATPEIEIAKGTMVVSQWGGSRHTYASTHKFRWSAAAKRLQLIGLDRTWEDTVLGGSREVSTNFLTGDRVTQTTPAAVDEEGTAVKETPKTKREKLPKRALLPLDKVEPDH
jgi:hypothetical protein